MLTRRQFLTGCAGTAAALAGVAALSEYKVIDKLIKSIPVLLYHRVGAETDDLTISVNRFEEDMAALSSEGYTALTLSQVKQRLREEGASLPAKPIVITFDDGYLDNYTNAFPILQKYSMTASFYIITGMIGNPERISAAQLREMQAAGMDFGSHTVSHRPLAELSLQDEAAELTNSKATLESILGKAVDFVAYPCGSYRQETLQLAGKAGYTGGFSTHYGFAMFNNHFVIRRIPIFHFDRSIAYVMFRKGFLPSMLS